MTDRATAAAPIEALASEAVQTSHATWRASADALDRKIDDIGFSMRENDPTRDVSDEWVKDLKENVHAKEHSAP